MSQRLSFLFGRALPLGIFGFMVAIQGQLALSGIQGAFRGELTRAAGMYLLNRLLTLAFFTFVFAIYIIRSRPVATNHSPLAVAAAMAGSLVLYALWLVPSGRTDSVGLLATSDVLLSLGTILALYSLTYLRQRFSIVPEARGLVTTGPYQLARHPIYLGEIISAFGLILPSFDALHLTILLLFIVLQARRMLFEEEVLRRAFPTYPAYARRTARIIPFVF